MQNQDKSHNGSGQARLQSSSFQKQSLNNDHMGFSHRAFNTNQLSIGGFGDRHSHRQNVPSINTSRSGQANQAASEMQTPGTSFDMNFTPLLPSQLLLGSPFQTGSPSTFASPHFQNFSSFAHASTAQQQGQQGQTPISPQLYQSLMSPTSVNASQFFNPQSPTGAYPSVAAPSLGGLGSAMQLTPGIISGSSRTVYMGNIPPETSAEEILSHVRSGQIESVRLLPDKNCAFISFLDSSSATHFHSDAILKKLAIQGNDIKIGWGKPTQVPASVALAVQQSGASRNVYLGNLSEDVTEAELREDLGKFGPIDTIKIVHEKAISFVHFLSIGNAMKAVSQLPQEAKWQAPRRVYYGKDRCAYVSKTQQQNAAQYLGIAPGYAHVLNGADRDIISNALAQQSVAAAAVATSAGGANNLGNRTVYLGNIHPETTIEEICNVVRGGLLHHIRYIPDKHISFVTFIDPTSAATFYALSNIQGLMIHNRRLKIGWGKHSGALPPAIALAVSGGASRNVYVGNLDETWSEERLRQDFAEYGEIELVNTLREKSCAFVNFTNIANAIKAIEAIRGHNEYKRFKINFGKDRCGNPPRQVSGNVTGNNGTTGNINANENVNANWNDQNGSQSQKCQQSGTGSLDEIQEPSPLHGLPLTQSQTNLSISPTGSVAPGSIGPSVSNGSHQSLQAQSPSVLSTASNPLMMYLQVQQNQHQQQYDVYTKQKQQQQHSNFFNNSFCAPPSTSPSPVPISNHASSTSISISHSNPSQTTTQTINGLLAPSNACNQTHSRAASLPVFSQGPFASAAQGPNHGLSHGQGQSQSGITAFGNIGSGLGGFGGGGYGLTGLEGQGLNGWMEEEIRAQ